MIRTCIPPRTTRMKSHLSLGYARPCRFFMQLGSRDIINVCKNGVLDKVAQPARHSAAGFPEPVCKSSSIKTAIGNQDRRAFWPAAAISIVHRLMTVSAVPSPSAEAVPQVQVEVLISEKTTKTAFLLPYL